MSFKSVQQTIEKKDGVSKDSAGAILAAASRKASPAAKKKNPNLKKVKGSPIPKGSPISKAMGGI